MTSKNNSTRIDYFDLARSVAVLWIVGYWHVRAFVGDSYKSFVTYNWFDLHFTHIFLGLFMFLSGFFLSKYRFDYFWEDAKRFYIKRFTRFYVLYAISAILLFLIGFNPGKICLINSLLGISTFILPQPLTLWFISMLMSFYLVTPFLLASKSKMGLAFVLLLSAGILLNFLLPKGIDKRFFWCFPLYFTGLVIGINCNIMKFITNHYIGVSTSISTCVILVLLSRNDTLYHYYEYLVIPLGITACIYWCRILCKLPIKTIVTYISYCSMCAYLFHREIYLLFKKVYHYFNLDLPWAFTIFVIVPICFIMSYFIQLTYDKILSLVKNT